MSFTVTKSPDGVVSVRCENAEQVRDVVGLLLANGHATATNGATTGAATATTPTATKPASTDENTPEEVLDPLLPLVEGPVDFDLVRKVAKQINWIGSERELRSAIVAKRRNAAAVGAT